MQVCLLPLTPETEGIIDAKLLSWLPKVSEKYMHQVNRTIFGMMGMFVTDPSRNTMPQWTSIITMLQGATVINGARGKHMVEADVLAALDSGQVGRRL